MKLFGPVLFYELIRTARRGRYIFARVIYAGILLALLTWVYFIWQLEGRGVVEARRMAAFAGWFASVFLIVQMVTVVVLTPIYTAGAIAEEKDRKTLDFMLATDLTSREIILGKLTSRVCNIFLLVLSGLPVLAFLQFLGGVDPNLIAAGFAGTVITLVSLASLSIFLSVYTRKSRDAIALTYVTVGAYFLLSGMGQWLLSMSRWGSFPSTASWTSPITLQDMMDVLNAGNCVSGLIRVLIDLDRNIPLHESLPWRLLYYLVFHAVVTVVCLAWSTLRLRAIALKEAQDSTRTQPLLTRLLGRPRVGRLPMIWKEVFAEPGLRLNWIGRIVVAALVLASFLPLGFILADFVEKLVSWNPPQGGVAPAQNFRNWNNPWYVLSELSNVWVRIVGTMVACLLLLAVAVRAAGSVSGERDRRTLDELVTTPLPTDAILFAKWLGSVLSVRWAWLWLGVIWLAGVVTGGVYALALPCLLLGWFIYAAVFAVIGVWFSVVCRSTMRATLWTLGTVIFIGGLHWLPASLLIYMPLASLGTQGRDMEPLLFFEWGQTPPLVLGMLAFFRGDFNRSYSHWDNQLFLMVGFSIFGLLAWSGAAAVIWSLAHHAFRRQTNRIRRRPRLGPPAPKSQEVILDALPVPE